MLLGICALTYCAPERCGAEVTLPTGWQCDSFGNVTRNHALRSVGTVAWPPTVRQEVRAGPRRTKRPLVHQACCLPWRRSTDTDGQRRSYPDTTPLCSPRPPNEWRSTTDKSGHFCP